MGEVCAFFEMKVLTISLNAKLSVRGSIDQADRCFGNVF